MEQEFSEIKRVIKNLITFGITPEVDYDNALFRVKISNRLTAWFLFLVDFGGNFKKCWPIRVGTLALLACSSLGPANAIAVQMLYCAELSPPPLDPNVDLIKIDDQAVYSYNSDTSSPKIDVPVSGKIALSVGSTALYLTSGQTGLSIPTFKGVEA